MISPQSIAVACASTGLVGQEGALFRFTVPHSVFFVAILSVLTYLQATVLAWMVPVAVRAALASTATQPSHSTGWTLLVLTGAIVAGVAVLGFVARRRPRSPPVTQAAADELPR